MTTPNEFLIGVNYWPAKKFVRMWKKFDAEKIFSDFSKAKEFNIGLIRFFLFLEDFQPQPTTINKRQVENLNEVLSIADKLGIYTIPTIFVGHMSGPNWLPSWAISEKENDTGKVFISGDQESKNKPRNLYTDEFMLDAEKFLITEVVKNSLDHKSIYAWDLSNEMDNIQDPSEAEATAWQKEILRTLKQVDPNHLVTHGVHIKETRGRGFPLKVMGLDDIVSVHSYPMYEGKAPTDTEHVAETIAFAKTANKPVILAEFGVATSPNNKEEEIPLHWANRSWKQPFVTEESQSIYLKETVEKAKELGCKAALVWCWSDYDQSLYNQLPFNYLIHERYFGLFRADGSPKPVALTLKSFK
jgi:endo-1,4-beta-mannosidase